MASSNPLVQAVQHFSLQQLMADVNLCRNVLNDIGAEPGEIFLLVAALEARVPQSLMENNATDLSVVEPRLVAELNQRGIERARAEWAVNAWKEVTGTSSLGQQTVARISTPATHRPTEPSDTGWNEPATARATAPTSAPPPPAGPPIGPPISQPPSQPPAAYQPPPPPSRPVPPQSPSPQSPSPQSGGPWPVPVHNDHRARNRILVGLLILLLVAAGVFAGRLSSNNSKKASGGSSSSGGSPSPTATSPTKAQNSSSAATDTSAPAPNLTAPLGAPKTFPVAGTSAWTDTTLMVTKGQRIQIVATGQIEGGPGQPCGPDGLSGTALDVFSVIGGGHTAGLIGLIAGSAAPFFVGANYNGVAPESGRLYLGINDLGVSNNSGQFTITLRLQQGS
jgi:hypothetical protein